MHTDATILNQLQTILESSDHKLTKVQRLAEAVRFAGGDRRIGLYDVEEKEIAVIAWSGASAPTFPCLRVAQGLNGAAVASRMTVIVNDVASNPRELTTFGGTQSERIVPVIHPARGIVIGAIAVESANKNAFTDSDRRFLEACSRAIVPLWD